MNRGRGSLTDFTRGEVPGGEKGVPDGICEPTLARGLLIPSSAPGAAMRTRPYGCG
jgi:hypothetical protein